ncbi:MAG TPA: retron system putative HNH endonuclease, partial [Anaerolineae bacterium]
IRQHRQGGLKPSRTLWNKYNKPYVRDTLKEMFHDKCAYCEAKITHVAYPHIEHYRPKKKYPQYTFEWKNLLLACGICNGSAHKGDNFPLQDGDEDNPLLLNPCEDDPAQHLQFEYARVVPLSERGRQTCKLLGLNTRDELFDQRRGYLHHIYYIRCLVEICERNGDQMMAQQGQTLLNRATSVESEYTAMVRQFLASPLPQQPPL